MLRHIIIIGTLIALHSTAYANKVQQKLHSTQKQIKQSKAFLQNNKKKLSIQEKELKQVETNIGINAKNIFDAKVKLKRIKQELPTLKKRLAARQTQLTQQQQLVAEQFKACYLLNNNNSLKLILTQKNPDTIVRMLSYQQYMYQALASEITIAQQQISTLQSLKFQVASQNRALTSLHSKLQNKQNILEAAEQRRAALLAELHHNRRRTSKKLKLLQLDEKNLLEQLKQLRGVFVVPSQGFAKHKASHSWPLKFKRFVVPDLRGHVIIPATKGDRAQAIFSGRVIFANWLRGFGLLLILDHGDGYMSLYGHNQALFKRVGDWVEQQDLLALVGQSGGQQNLSLYFEIRKDGKAINLNKWFK